MLGPGAVNITRWCFNPHPPLRADAIVDVVLGDEPLGVSILTRPYGRMLLEPVG